VWVPNFEREKFFNGVTDLKDRGYTLVVKERPVDPELTVPTMFRQTEFSQVFQQIVDTYGVPNYKEANPALFTCITFPFLFGVMFGDIMHGSLLLGFSLWVYWAGKASSDALTPHLWGIKHFLLLMGIFSTFCGFCYNDYGSTPLYLFGRSCYDCVGDQCVQREGCVYPIGVDPTWFLSTSELTFMNSIKMKIAVIFGVAQMSLGICLKGSNNLFKKQYVDFVFEFLPQIIIMLALFGYMDYLIVIKWLTDWEGRTANSPSVISTMIDMFLNGGKPTIPTDEPLIAETWEVQTSV
jgi:V-type H+-transporting ATPase subunit a